MKTEREEKVNYIYLVIAVLVGSLLAEATKCLLHLK